MRAGAQLRLTKHHGAGNDFLVLLDSQGTWGLEASEVVALCDRRRGVGADGLLRATPGAGGAELAMELHNADGSPAEMSGNGIRCLVQAAVAAGWVPAGDVKVDTATGRRLVQYRAGPGPGEGFALVDMGPAVLGPELVLDGPAGARAGRAVDMGNPHVVLLMEGPADDAVVTDSGPRLERSVAGGANVEFVWAAEPGAIALRVWERGVGETLACGTGTCAAAVAARTWGLVDGRCAVHNPGGVLEVELGDGTVMLGGPTVQVATVEVDGAVLAALAAQVRAQRHHHHEVAAGR